MCLIYSMLTIKTPEQRLVLLLLTLNIFYILSWSYIKPFVWYNLYDSQSVFSFSLRLHFHTTCSYRYVKSHALNVCQVTRIETHALLELHTQKNTGKVSHAFPNISKYIFETPCSKIFLKPDISYAGMNHFKEFISY